MRQENNRTGQEVTRPAGVVPRTSGPTTPPDAKTAYALEGNAPRPGYDTQQLLRAAAAVGEQPAHPRQIGSYRIIRVLGEGGMGVVYEAEQQSPRRPVALKVIRPFFVNRTALKRFAVEAEVLGLLEHPGIARIYEAGTADGGAGHLQPFFAMELVSGMPLTTFAEAAKLNTRQRLKILARVCDAVHYAHQKGVVHRDLKPANILVNHKGVSKILDFGVARATDLDIHATLPTEHGGLVGTLPYMSPEQASGDPRQLDTRSDVYALGVIAYELLAGRLPYDLKNKSLPEVVRVIREEEPSRLGSIDRTWRGEVETIIGKALEKEKDRRYASAAGMAADIRRYLAYEPIEAMPPSTWYQVSRFARRNRILVAGLAAMLIVLSLGVLGTSVGLVRAARAQRDTEKARTAAVNAQAAAERNAIVAQQQKNTANAEKSAADVQRKLAERRVAENLVSQGDLLGLTSGWGPARAAYAEAAAIYQGLGDSPKLSDLADLNANRFSPPPLLALPAAHAGGVTCVALGRDGRTLVSGGNDGAARIWDAPTGHEEGRFAPSLGTVTAVAVSDSGRIVALGTASGHVLGWEWASGRTAFHLYPTGEVRAIRFDQTGRQCLVASPRSVVLWSVDGAPKQMRRLAADTPINDAALSPDGKTAAVVDDSGSLSLWDLTSGVRLWTRAAHNREAFAVAMSRNGGRLLTGGYDNTAILWDMSAGNPIQTFKGHTSGVRCVAIDDDARRGLSAGQDGTIRSLDLRTGRELLILVGHSGTVGTVALTPNGETAASGGYDGAIKTWETTAWLDRSVVATGDYSARASAVSPDGRFLFVKSSNELTLWDRFANRRYGSWRLSKTSNCQFSEDGKGFYFLSGNTVGFQSFEIGAAPRKILAFDSRKTVEAALVLSPDRQLVLSSDKEGTIRVRRAADGAQISEFRFPGRVRAAGFCSAGQAVWASGEGKLAIKRNDEADPHTYPVPEGVRQILGVSPDGRWGLGVLSTNQSDEQGRDLLRWALSGTADARAASGGAGGGRIVFQGHTNYVNAALISPDGSAVLSGGCDGTLRAWDAATGKLLRTLSRHQPSPDGDSNILWNLAQSDNGEVVAASFGDGVVEVWDLGRPERYRQMAARVESALSALRYSPREPSALAAMAEWYRFRGLNIWARQVELAGGLRSPASATLQNGTIDVLPQIRAEDATTGQWRKSSEGLISDETDHALIELPVDIPEEYDLRVEFLRNSGNGLLQLGLCHQGSTLSWMIDFEGHTALALVSGLDCNNPINPTYVRSPQIQNGKRYVAQSHVRRNSISCSLDDVVLFTLKLESKNAQLTRSQWWDPSLHRLTLGSDRSSFTFHNIKLSVPSGAAPATQPAIATGAPVEADEYSGWSPAQLDARGDSLGQRGQFREARDMYVRARRSDPTESWYWVHSASACVALGDMGSYREQCRDMLDRFGSTNDPGVADRVAKLCVLVPDAVPDRSRVLKLATLAASAEGDRWHCFYELCLGMAHYRDGRNTEAAADLARSRQESKGSPACRAEAALFLAMVSWRQDRRAEAAALLKEADDVLANVPPDNHGAWWDWLFCCLTEREARALMGLPFETQRLPIAIPRVVDLLQLVDLSRDVIDGNWSLGPEGLTSGDEPTDKRVRVPYHPPEEYDYRIEFTVLKSIGHQDVNQICSLGDQSFQWLMGGWGNAISGIEWINGERALQHAAQRGTNLISAGVRHSSVVRVRRDGITTVLDGRELGNYPGQPSGLSLPGWGVGFQDLGLGTLNVCRFHRAEVVEMSGRGQTIQRLDRGLIGTTSFPIPGKLGSTVSLTSLEPCFAQVGFDMFRKNQALDGQHVVVDGKRCDDFLFAHAPSSLAFDVPKGAIGFRAYAVTTTQIKSARCAVLIDGNEAMISKSMRESGGQIMVKVPIRDGARRIELQFVPDDRSNCHTAWAYPQFVFPAAARVTQPAIDRGERNDRVVFVVDARGALLNRFDAANAKIGTMLDSLKPTQLFDIVVTQDQHLQVFRNTLVPATTNNAKLAKEYLASIQATGVGSLLPGVSAAINLHPDVLWIIDNGDQSPNVLSAIHNANTKVRARINTLAQFAEQADDNRHALWQIAHDNGGTCVDEDGKAIDEPISGPRR